MHWTTPWRSHLAVVAMLCGAVSIAMPAHAGDIAIIDGSLDAQGISGGGRLILEGDRGFRFQGSTLSGNYQPGLCSGMKCAAGDRISLFASWSGSDVVGTATLDGTTYPRVGDNFDTSATNASLLVAFHGTARLPSWAEGNVVTAPFLLTATFSHTGGPEALAGSGTATIELYQIAGFPEERWGVRRIVYELAGRLATPWVSQDIGVVGLPGHASQVDDTVVVLGDGRDIWGTADSFRFAGRELSGAARISARVVTQDKTYPAPWGDAAALDPFAKAGVMIRASSDAGAANVVLDAKPSGELELMARYSDGAPTTYLGGAFTSGGPVWLALARDAGGVITASYSMDGLSWTVIGSVTMELNRAALLAGLAVTSHDPTVLNGALFDHIVAAGESTRTDLLERGDFEDYDPPLLGPPGWVSDDMLRQVPAKSETHQPRSGAKNGACWTTTFLDCGMYQEVIAPISGPYTLRIYASADRAGGLVGANVNGATAASSDVEPRPFGSYAPYVMSFQAAAGDVIRVWMYSPAVPGYVVVDDASLVASSASEITSGSWVISALGGPFGRFDLESSDFVVHGTYDSGTAEVLRACSTGASCVPGQQVGLDAAFENLTPVTFESLARGSIVLPDGGGWDFVEFGGAVRLDGGTVTLPTPAPGQELVTVSAPFTASGELRGYEVLGLREPREVFRRGIEGRGTATLELIAAQVSGTWVLTVYRMTYAFEPSTGL
jgi:hypothetical protein